MSIDTTKPVSSLFYNDTRLTLVGDTSSVDPVLQEKTITPSDETQPWYRIMVMMVYLNV